MSYPQVLARAQDLAKGIIRGSTRNKHGGRLLAFFGHHKCASRFINAKVMKDVCERLGIIRQSFYLPLQFDYELGRFFDINQRITFLSYTNCDIRYVRQLTDYRGFHVIRDPRDILVSAYFSHRYSHPTKNWPELVEHRGKQEKLDLEEGLLSELDFLEELPTRGVNLRVFQSLKTWNYDDPGILELRYEDMLVDQTAFFTRILAFLGLMSEPGSDEASDGKLTQGELRDILDKYSFSRLAKGREQGEQDARSHFRKGVAGDWKNHFSPAVTREFHKRYGDLLIQLGYEADDSWIDL